jgi:hypothetical protein
MYTSYLPALGDAFTAMRSLDRQSITLQLIQSFRGIELKHDVRMLEIGPNSATFQATHMRMCAALEGHVYLHSSNFPAPVAARLTNIDTKRGLFVLSGFAYREIEWKERQQERVRPGQPVYVDLRRRGKVLHAPLENISIGGMGVLAHHQRLEKEMNIQPGMVTQFDFHLPPDHQFKALKGTVIYLRPVDSSVTRLGVQLHPNARQARSLDSYVAEQKEEIIAALDAAYLERSNPWSVERMYF